MNQDEKIFIGSLVRKAKVAITAAAVFPPPSKTLREAIEQLDASIDDVENILERRPKNE